tara:strand:- start:1426 stop:1584 length:159 start_codon:yes stop_codon:yes gene_type:complete
MKNKCFACGKEVIWGGDFDYEDFGLTGEGIVSNYSCSSDKCSVHYEVYQPFD